MGKYKMFRTITPSNEGYEQNNYLAFISFKTGHPLTKNGLCIKQPVIWILVCLNIFLILWI